jgi:TRAP-type C4-dicarboxylate transport system permease small subunit
MNAGPAPTRLVGLLAKLERAVLSGLMAAIVILTLAQVIWRYGLERPLQWSEEVARYCFVWLTFLGAAVLMRQREGHPAIDVLALSVGARARHMMEIASRLVTIVGSLAISVGGFRMVQLQWSQLSPSLEVPMVWIYLSMALCPLLGVFWIVWCMRYGSVEDAP